MNEIVYDSLELLYLYVENIRCFKSQEFKFTNEYIISYKKNERLLTIEKKTCDDHLKDFFGQNISSINVIVGKNGCGKTTLLQIIGNEELDRDDILHNWLQDNNSQTNSEHYFLVFKTNDNRFYIEGYNNCIEKINHSYEDDIPKYDKKYFNFIFDLNTNKILYSIDKPFVKIIGINKKSPKFPNSHKKINSNIIYVKSKKNNKIPMTKALPLLRRNYSYLDEYNKKYSLLYKLLSSNHEFIKLFSTNIDILLKIKIFYDEQLAIFKILFKAIEKVEKKSNNTIGLALFILSSIIIQVSKLSITSQRKTYRTRSLIINDLLEMEEELNNFHNEFILIEDELVDVHTSDFFKISSLINSLDKKLLLLKDEFTNYLNNIKNSNNISKTIYNNMQEIKNSLVELNNLLSSISKYDDTVNDFSIIDAINKFYNTYRNIDKIFNNINKFIILTADLNKFCSKNNVNNSLNQYELINKFFDEIISVYFKSDLIFKPLNEDEKEAFINLIQSTLKLEEKSFDFFYDDLYPACFQFKINQNIKFIESTYNFFKAYDEFHSRFKIELFYYYFKHNLSEGELRLLYDASKLFEILNSINYSSIIILDEPDENMHPDWSRTYIFNLVNMTNEILKNKKHKLQFIITTHSPFLLSDIPKEYINAIDIVINNDGEHIRKVKTPEKSFACNYYDMIKESFFLNDTIGGFASDKIKKIHKILSNNLNNIEKHNITKENIINELKRDVNIDTEDKLLNFIKCIGEPIIKIQLQYLWSELNKHWIRDISNFINHLNKEEKRSIYKLLSLQLNEPE